MRKTISSFILIILLIAPSFVYSKPIIKIISKDQLVHNESVSIFGTNFGKKNQSKPLVYDNFDENSVGRQNGDIIAGKNCSHYGKWRNSTYNVAPTYSNSENRDGSKLCSYHYVRGGTGVNHAPMWVDFSDKNEETLLISFWTKLSYTLGSDDSWQLKYFRLTNGTSDTDDNTYFQDLWWTNRTPGLMGYFEFFLNPTNPAWTNYSILQKYSDVSLDYDKKSNVWNNYVIFIKQSDSKVSNGIVQIWIDGKQIANETSMVTFETGEIVKSATFMWYLGNNEGDGSATVYFDDVYIDNSWASIWIGEKQNWSDCNHKEIQIPIKWPRVTYTNQDRIDFIVNKGSFKGGDQAYLFLINEDGEVSDGKLIGF